MSSESEFSQEDNNYNHYEDDENKNSDSDNVEPEFEYSDFDYKIVSEDDESEGDLKIDEQLQQLAEVNKRDIYVEPDKLLRKIGILDPMGLEDNPLTGKPYENLYYNPDLEWDSSFTYKNGMKAFNRPYADFAKDPRPGKNGWAELSMYSQAEEAIKVIYNHQVVLLTSGTGSGKTVLTPKFALHALNYKGRIAITLPKIPPVDAASPYAAACLDVVLGEHVSQYHGKLDKSSSNNILFYSR